MTDWKINEQQLLDINTVIQRHDDVVVWNAVTRTAQESKLFPIMPYLILSLYDSYYRWPEVIRQSNAVISPEEVGNRARNATVNLSKITAWQVVNLYLEGRELLIKAGLLRPEDNLEDLWVVCDWIQRFSAAYHRNEGHRHRLDAWDIAQEHDERVLQVFEADAFEVDDELRRAASQFMAVATQYSFLVHCESRVGLGASGPYSLGERKLMHTRDWHNLSECDFSWLDGVAKDVPFNNLTAVVITDDVKVEITDWGSVYTSPEEFRDRIVGFGLYTSDFLSDRYIPVGMDNKRDLIDTLDQLVVEIRKATRGLYKRFSAMNGDQMIEAGIYAYYHAAADMTHMAGLYKQDEWQFIDDRTRRLWPLHNEEYSMDAYLGLFVGMDGLQASQNEYYLHPVKYQQWLRSDSAPLPHSGRKSIMVPMHVINDHDYPRRVNPNGMADIKGSTLLPPKTGLYNTTAGRLTEDELNRAAREMSSPLHREPWRNFDESTAKYRWQTEEVDAWYRYSQEHSRLLAGKGASLLRKDIADIRRDAGERPWSEVSVAAQQDAAAT
jgi:hypothetical protein